MNDLVFYPTRIKMILLSIVAFLAGVFCIYLSYISFTDPAEENWFMGIISLLLVIIILPASFFMLKKSLMQEGAVIINDKGITINVQMPKIGFIPWQDIEGCLLYSVSGQTMIGFIIPNEDEYINKFSGMGKKALQANQAMGHPAINIALNLIKDKVGLLEELEKNVGFYEKEII